MPKVNFYLDKPNGGKETKIFLFFSYEGKRLRFSTGQKIHPNNWNKKKQRAKGGDFAYTLELNKLLNKLQNAISTEYLRILNENEMPVPKRIKDKLSRITRTNKNFR